MPAATEAVLPDAFGRADPVASTDAIVDGGAKEIAEHLRLIHFTLVVTCATLLTAMTVDTSDQLGRALDELNQVKRLHDGFNRRLRTEHWSRERWVYEQADAVAQSKVPRPTLPLWASADFDWIARFSGELRMGEYRRAVTASAAIHRLLVPNWPRSSANPSDRGDGAEPIERLEDFKELWDRLDTIDFVTSRTPGDPFVAANRATGFGPSTERYRLVGEYRWTYIGPFEGRPEASGSMADATFQHEFKSRWDVAIAGLPPATQDANWFVGMGQVAANDDDKQAASRLLHDAVRDVALVAPVRETRVEFSPKRIWCQAADVAYRPGPFQRSFPDLFSVTEKLGGLRIEDVDAVLQAERARTGERAEFFGLKLPVSSLSQWGLAVLIAVQLYLVVHLSAFRRVLTRGRGVPHVAFIMLYPHWLPRAVFLVSTVALPAIVGSLALWRSGPARFIPVVLFVVVTSLAIAAACALAGSWRSRAVAERHASERTA